MNGARERLVPLVEKYRPRTFEELCGQRHAVGPLSEYVRTMSLPNVLLHGPAGTGKTSTVQAIARTMYGKDGPQEMLELNASDDRGIDCVRNKIREYASSRRMFSEGPQLVVLDEVDAMTQHAMLALRRLIESSAGNARFVLICNQASRILPALRSRCVRFRFPPLPDDVVAARLRHVCRAEQRPDVPEAVLEAVVQTSSGDLRKALNSLQTVLNMPDLSAQAVCTAIGTPLEHNVAEVVLLVSPGGAPGVHSAAAQIAALQVRHGIALRNLVHGLYATLLRDGAAGPPVAELVRALAQAERALTGGGYEEVQLLLVTCALQRHFRGRPGEEAAGPADSAGETLQAAGPPPNDPPDPDPPEGPMVVVDAS